MRRVKNTRGEQRQPDEEVRADTDSKCGQTAEGQGTEAKQRWRRWVCGGKWGRSGEVGTVGIA